MYGSPLANENYGISQDPWFTFHHVKSPCDNLHIKVTHKRITFISPSLPDAVLLFVSVDKVVLEFVVQTSFLVFQSPDSKACSSLKDVAMRVLHNSMVTLREIICFIAMQTISSIPSCCSVYIIVKCLIQTQHYAEILLW